MSLPQTYRILVVEDHADSAAILTRLLERCGYEVFTTSRVCEALAEAETRENGGNPFQLLVSDLGLPDATGFELMGKIRERHHIPGIALSGYGQAQDVERALEAGFTYHLTKPIDFDKLKCVIEKLLAQAPTAVAN